MKRAADQVTFYGAAGGQARLWQGGSQVEAPVIQFDQRQRRLMARGAGQGAAMAVPAVLGRGEAARCGAGSGGAVRVTRPELNYSDEARKAEFSCGGEGGKDAWTLS